MNLLQHQQANENNNYGSVHVQEVTQANEQALRQRQFKRCAKKTSIFMSFIIQLRHATFITFW